MDDKLSTPKTIKRRRTNFLSPASASPYRSPMLNKVEKKVVFNPKKASPEELGNAFLELWQKNEDIKQNIASLKNEGFEETQLKWYIDKLHEYNDIKDIAQKVMGKIAVADCTTVRKIHEEFGMANDD